MGTIWNSSHTLIFEHCSRVAKQVYNKVTPLLSHQLSVARECVVCLHAHTHTHDTYHAFPM